MHAGTRSISREVVYFGGAMLQQYVGHPLLIFRVPLNKLDSEMTWDTFSRRFYIFHRTHHFIVMLQKQLGQIEAILTGYSGDQRSLHSAVLLVLTSLATRKPGTMDKISVRVTAT